MDIIKKYAKTILIAVVLLLLGGFCVSLHFSLLSRVLTVAGHYYTVKMVLAIYRDKKDTLHLQDTCARLLCDVRKVMRTVREKINRIEANRS